MGAVSDLGIGSAAGVADQKRGAGKAKQDARNHGRGADDIDCDRRGKGELMFDGKGYAEYRRRQHEYEREQWRNASPEERERRIQMRKEYLFGSFAHNSSWAYDILECPHCQPGLELEVTSYPSHFICLNCSHVCVVDKDSHITNGSGVMTFIEPLEGLGDRYIHYRW